MKKFILGAMLVLSLMAFACAQNKSMEKKSMDALKGKEGVFAVLKLSKGEVVVELYYKDTPLTVVNFVGLAEGTLDAAKGKPFYDGLKFHRVISKANGDEQDFMIQGGDPEGTGRGGPGYRFADEIVSKYTFAQPGVLAMANAGPGTNGSQFFITIVPTTWLNGKHTIFGKVISGQDVVDKTLQGDKIEKVTIIRQGKEAEAFKATQAEFDNLSKKANEAARAANEVAAKQYLSLVKESATKFFETKESKYSTNLKLIEKKWLGFEEDEYGIFYKVTKDGSGEKCGVCKTATVNYKGFLLDGTVFDSGSFDFTTAGREMIPGFDISVIDMKLGEKRTILIPPYLHYGEQGYGPIPANSYIGFEIELLSVN